MATVQKNPLLRVKPIDLILKQSDDPQHGLVRRTQPNLRRGFRTPWVPVIPILSILASFVLIVSLPGITLIRFAIWLVIGLFIYFLYSQRNSRLQQELAEEAPGQDIA